MYLTSAQSWFLQAFLEILLLTCWCNFFSIISAFFCLFVSISVSLLLSLLLSLSPSPFLCHLNFPYRMFTFLSQFEILKVAVLSNCISALQQKYKSVVH